MTPAEDEERQALVDNLAASIYKQAEQANEAQDYRAAAGHFLRITERAPTSSIRPAAEYDAAAALMKLQDWTAAAEVLDAFRAAFPEHELNAEATKQLAFVYREGGETSLAAGEYERVAAEAADPELERGALLSAGELYEQASDVDRALGVYERYLAEFAQPVDVAVETRFKVAEMYRARGDEPRYHEHLAALVAADAAAGAERTDRTRYLAAQAGLVLAEPRYAAFNAVQLVQPFEQNLALKRELMDAALQAFEDLLAVRSRRGHDGRHVPHGGDLLELQPLAARFRAADGPQCRRARRVRGSARGASVPVRRARDRGPRSERRRHDRGRHLQPLGRAELRAPRGARARALCEGRAEHRSARSDRDFHVPAAGRRGTPRAVAPVAEPERRRARRSAAKGPTIGLEVLAGRGLHDHGRGAREPGASRALPRRGRLSRARACTSAAWPSSKP